MSARRVAQNWLQKLASGALLAAALVSVPADAVAQVRSCSQITGTLQQLDRNRQFQSLPENSRIAQQLGSDLARLENAFVQAGCQTAINNGQSLSGDCSRAARQIQRGRRDMATLTQRIEEGQAVAQQRQVLLGQYQAQGCGTNSQSNVTVQTNQPRGFFEQLFDSLSGNGGFGNEMVLDPYAGFYGNTVRSVCVRTCDGYYWPISFSTVPDYLNNDLMQCRQQGQGADVDLFYYSNPGQTPNDMVNLSGQRYASLPNAFRYRNEFDASCIARPETTFGTIEIVQAGGQSRAILSIEDREIPLPLRDPRAENRVVTAEIVETVQIPLPRKRPSLDGDGNIQPVAIPTADAQSRMVEVGGRVVRLVGPDTPYAPSGEEES